MQVGTRQQGFSLIEATVATTLVAGVLMMAAQWVADGARVGGQSADHSVAAVLAAHKLEQLRSLLWAVDDSGVRRADLASDTSVDPPASGGGLGLTLAPAGSLESDVPGYVDYQTSQARTVDTRADAAFVRRWAIKRLPLLQNDGVVLEVCVLPLRAGIAWDVRDPRGHPDVACAASVRTRGVQ